VLAAAAATPMQEADLSGTWDLERGATAVPSPSPSPGMRLTVRVDSVRNGRPYGALDHLFSGNVGIDPASFDPMEGALSGDTATLVFPRRGAPEGGIAVVAVGSGDTLAVMRLVIGGDTTRLAGEELRLVRRR
jgi:hypothetical protein